VDVASETSGRSDQISMDIHQLWQQALGELELQMTRATFDTWLRNSRAMDIEEGVLVISVKNQYAVEWLTRRLYPTIQRTLQRITQKPQECRFVIDNLNEAAPVVLPPLMDDPPRVVVELMEFDPTQRGWFKVSNYALRFWLPYLGQDAFNLWQTLCAFAYSVKLGSQWPCIDTLADIVTDGSRKRLTGRDSHGKHYEGALETLERERIVRYEQLHRNGWYHFRVLEHLPLLTPQQVGKLPERLQTMHVDWVKRCDIDFEEWQQLAMPTLGSQE